MSLQRLVVGRAIVCFPNKFFFCPQNVPRDKSEKEGIVSKQTSIFGYRRFRFSLCTRGCHETMEDSLVLHVLFTSHTPHTSCPRTNFYYPQAR